MRLPSMPLALWVVGAFSVLASGACATARPAAPAVTPSGVRFVLIHPGARSVALAGSFNQWSASSDLLTRDPRGGAWTIVVTLPSGEHLFMYVVDGSQWISPPLAADYVDDGFGAKNGVVVVPPIEQ